VPLILAITAPLFAQETVTVGGTKFTLLGGEAFDGSLQERLTAEWKDFQALGRVLEDDGGKLTGAGTRVELAQRAGVIRKGDVDLHVWFLIAKSNGRIDRMVFVASTAYTYGKYGQDVAGMISGIRYVAPKPLEPLAGVCFGFSQVKTETRPECWIFLDGGVVFSGFPFGGPAHMDVDAYRRRSPTLFGEYKTEGDQVVVTMKGAVEPTRFAQSRGAWAAPVTRAFQDRHSGPKGNTIATWTDAVQTTVRITKAQPCDGLKLSGTYRLDVLESRYAPRPIPSIKFTDDGTFTEDGLVHEVDPGTPNDRSKMPAAGGRGKYSVANNTIDLTYQDGTTLGLTFLITDGELAQPAPRQIFLHRTKVLLAP
jgi:hypothetical protein